jgi:Tol biopolymer transport system component
LRGSFAAGRLAIRSWNREALVDVSPPVSRGVVLGTALSALLLALAPALASATSIAGPNGKIVFASGRGNTDVPSPADNDDTKAKIWVADYPGGTPVQLTTEPKGVQHRHPNWSPDHSKVVYAAGVAFNQPNQEYALWIYDLRTKTSSLFVPTAKFQDRPTWSPDGTRIAYGSEGDLWTKEVAPPFAVTRITETAGITEERPVWSPDGNTLYYNRKETGKTRDIYAKSPVTLQGAETGVVIGAEEDWQPAVSPDGKRLCFLRGAQDESANLWTVNVDGNGLTSFANTSTGELNCVWSPDGTRILYTLGAFSVGDLVSRNINAGAFQSESAFNVPKHFDGNADWATNFPPRCDAKSAEAPVNGFATVALSCTDPDHGFGAEPPTPEALDPQALEIASPPSHGTLGGLSTSTGKIVYTPNKDFRGTDSFTYTGSDEVSNAPPATVTIHVSSSGGGGPAGDTTPPTVSGIGISNRRWRAGTKAASISRTPVGTTISFKLSEAARATLTFKRKKGGKRAGSIAVAAKRGKNKVRFQGLLSKTKRLGPGSYRLVVSARDAAGNQSKPKRGPNFTIVTK